MRHRGRNTVCVSSQVGCSCGCSFCATSRLGFVRNLDVQEIVEQVLFFNRLLKGECLRNGEVWRPKNPLSEYRVRNVVFMGMGEPLLNYDNVFGAIDYFNDDKKFGIGQRKITISTIGIIPMIKKFAQRNMQVNLAVSLHASNDVLRSDIIPMNKKFGLSDLMSSLWDFVDMTGRRIFIEFVVIDGFNDDLKTVRELGKMLSNKLVHVNLIPLNEVEGVNLRKGRGVRINEMQKVLLNEFGVVSTVRQVYGDDIGGACGQLVGS